MPEDRAHVHHGAAAGAELITKGAVFDVHHRSQRPDDVRGTLNFIDEAARRAGAALVRRGACFSLAQRFDADGPQKGAFRRNNPVHVMLASGLDSAESHLENEQKQLMLRMNRVRPFINILGACSGLLLLLMAGLWVWRIWSRM